MLARANRLTHGDDYRNVVRRGSKVVGRHTITYVKAKPGQLVSRFGFITAKSVGGAVVRNRVRRQLKASCYLGLSFVRSDVDIVVRALPSAATVSWDSLIRDVHRGIGRGVDRQYMHAQAAENPA